MSSVSALFPFTVTITGNAAASVDFHGHADLVAPLAFFAGASLDAVAVTIACPALGAGLVEAGFVETGTGVTSDNLRASPHYISSFFSTGAPTNLVLKLPSSHTFGRELKASYSGPEPVKFGIIVSEVDDGNAEQLTCVAHVVVHLTCRGHSAVPRADAEA